MITVTHAMILAAGFGMRMRPLTLNTPKPLIKVASKSLIDYGIDKLRDAEVPHAVVNGHYLADQIEAWSKTIASPVVEFSDERDTILDTGGGIARALPMLGDEPFIVLNSDSFWIDDKTSGLNRLRSAWNDAEMDCLLLMCHPAQTTGFDGKGDFILADNGRILRYRKPEDPISPVYIGGYLVHPRLFKDAPAGAFSMHVLWRNAIANGRLFGLAHDGHWLHVGTVEAIAEAEEFLRRR
jgi:N-acetyl-alpha-D-muramate 1-phosphate uridylyltransferase